MFLTCAAIDRRHPSARQALSDCCDMHRNVMRLFAPRENMRAEACVLFRVLEERGMARLYLTSATPPDLSRAAWLFYGRDARQRDLSPLLEWFHPGIVFGFDLLAYPCKKVDVGRTNSVRAFLMTPEERRAWLIRQGEKNGFACAPCAKMNRRTCAASAGRALYRSVPCAFPAFWRSRTRSGSATAISVASARKKHTDLEC